MNKLSDTTMKHINESIFEKFGITYDEFAELDFLVQQEILNNYKKTLKYDKINKQMVGSGQHAIFVEDVTNPLKIVRKKGI